MRLTIAALSNLLSRTSGTLLTGSIDHDEDDVSEALRDISKYNRGIEDALQVYEAQETINKQRAKLVKKAIKAKLKEEMSQIDISDLDLKW